MRQLQQATGCLQHNYPRLCIHAEHHLMAAQPVFADQCSVVYNRRRQHLCAMQQIPEQELASAGNLEKAKELGIEDKIEEQEQEEEYEEQMSHAESNEVTRPSGAP